MLTFPNLHIIFCHLFLNMDTNLTPAAKKEHMNTANLETPAVPLRYTKPHPHQPQDAEQETTRKFDNPIYGDDGDEVAGGARDNEPNMDQSRLLSMSLPDHEFDNPIYATEETNNPYSTITDASTQDSETNRQLQATYESIHDEQLPSSYRPLANGTFGQ